VNSSKRQIIDEPQGFTDNKLKETYENKTDSDNNSNVSSGSSSINKSQVHESHLSGSSSETHAALLGDRKVLPVEDAVLLEELDDAGDAFWHEFNTKVPLSFVDSGMVDGKGVMIAVIDLPDGTPVSLPSTFQLSPGSKKFPVIIDYGAIMPWSCN